MKEIELIKQLNDILSQYNSLPKHQLSDIPYTYWKLKLDGRDYILTLIEEKE